MEHFFNQLQKNWVLILFLGSVVMSWAVFSSRLAQAEKDIANLQSQQQAIVVMQVDIAVIKNQLININDKIQ